MRSASSSMATPMDSRLMVAWYTVASWDVNALERPPCFRMMRAYSSGATLSVPLNIMCSRRCAMPLLPSTSLRDPTRYHT